VPGFFSDDAAESVRSLQALLGLCFLRKPTIEDFYLMTGYSVSVPAYVRRGLFSRTLDNDDLLPKIRKPVLITHATHDAVVKAEVVEQHRTRLPQAQIHMMEGVGHGVFWDDAPAFNQRLREFCRSWGAKAQSDQAAATSLSRS
jgi:pimeloyl-ACP methyl ester carboxylesterase